MKITKSIILIIALAITVSLFSIVVNASVDDPSTYILVGTPSQMSSGTMDRYYHNGVIDSWSSLIDSNEDEFNLFFYEWGYVGCNGFLVTLNNELVKVTDPVRCSSEGKYVLYSFDDLITIEDNCISFNSILNELEFLKIRQLVVDVAYATEYKISSYGDGAVFVKINDLLLYDEVDENFVLYEHKIDSNKIYKLEEIICPHDWSVISYLVNPTCSSEGLANYYCKLCYENKVDVVPVKEYAHYRVDEVKVESTCFNKGYLKWHCSICNYNYYCDYDLKEHDLDFFGVCQNPGCSYNATTGWIEDNISDPLKDAFNKIGEGFDDGKEKFDDNISDPIKDAFNKIGEGFDDAKEKFDDILKILSAIPIIFLVIVCLMVIPQIMSFISSWLNLKKHYREYKENKKNKKGKRK